MDMDIPPDLLGPISQFYQVVKQTAVELVKECHDPDYETTLENVRRCVSKAEEEAFQLRLFEYEDTQPKVGKAAV